VTGSNTFLTRWSRLKRAHLKPPTTAKPEAAATPAATPAAGDQAGPAAAKPEPSPPGPVEAAALPALESIAEGSDIRAFLQSGVPAELTKAALRRAWTVDPAIRDFIGIAENQWDFTDPSTIPGFGPLAPDEGGLLAQALGQGLPPATRAGAVAASPERMAGAPSQALPQVPALPDRQAHGIPERNAAISEQSGAVEEQQQSALAAMQHAEPAAEPARPPSRRSHGSALPK